MPHDSLCHQNDPPRHRVYLAGVAVLPGSSFGTYGSGYLRLSYANSLTNLERALDKIEQALAPLT